MFRDVVFRWLLRRYEHNLWRRRGFGLFVARVLRRLYAADEQRFLARVDECVMTVGRLDLLIVELEGKEEE